MNTVAEAAPAQTLFYGCADRKYEDFAPLHAASVLSHVSSAIVEIGVEDVHAYLADHGVATDIIRRVFGPQRLIVTRVDWMINSKRIVPNSQVHFNARDLH